MIRGSDMKSNRRLSVKCIALLLCAALLVPTLPFGFAEEKSAAGDLNIATLSNLLYYPDSLAGDKGEAYYTYMEGEGANGRDQDALLEAAFASLKYQAERSGLAFVVSTPDPNITAERIADEYEIFYRSVKVMPPGYSNVIEEVTSKAEETSRAYLATRGRCGSLARAIGGCIGIKSNISLGIVIGIFGILLGVLLCATLVLYASVGRLSIVELGIYIGFWIGATLIAELIRRP